VADLARIIERAADRDRHAGVDPAPLSYAASLPVSESAAVWRSLATRGWRLLGKHFRWVAGVATVVGVAIALWGQRDALANFDWRLAPAPFLGAIALFTLAPFVQAFSFWLALRFIGVPARLEEALLLWMRSFLLRYAPSGALAIVMRIRERARLEASSEEIWAVTGYENLAALCAGAFVAVAAFAVDGA